MSQAFSGAFDGDVSGFQRSVTSTARPKSIEELSQIVAMWYRDRKRFYVVSTGLNWGYGTSLPAESECALLSLQHIATIRYVTTKTTTPYAVIEAGVSQGQLAQHLAAHHPGLLINPTGSSPASSIVGNCLDRGIGYFGLRSDDVLSLQIMLPTGKTVWTTRPDPSHPSFPFKSGPDFTQTMLQSRGCIVVAAAIRLYHRQPQHAALSIEVSTTAQIGLVVRKIQDCVCDSNHIGVTHIGNRNR
ncbi:MAG: FAD-binding oxidoreductase, partial [Casimicrobium sp.]